MEAKTSDLLLARRLVESGVARSVREAAGLSRPEAAEECHVTPGAIYLWEKARRRPRGAKGAAYGRFLRELMNATLPERSRAS